MIRCSFRLSRRVLTLEQGPGSRARNLTEGISFSWCCESCGVKVAYDRAGKYFSVRMTAGNSLTSNQAVGAALYSGSGQLVEELHDDSRTDEGRRGLRWQGTTTGEGRITALNYIARAEDREFFLRLGPLFRL